MYFIRIESFVFSDLSHITNTLPVSKAEHFSLIVLLLVSSSKPETGVSVGDRK